MYTLTVRLSPSVQQPEYLELYLSVLRSWSPARSTDGRSLTIAPDWPASFTIAQFGELMKLINGPTEDALLHTTEGSDLNPSDVYPNSAFRDCTNKTLITVNIMDSEDWDRRRWKGTYGTWFPRSRKLKRVRIHLDKYGEGRVFLYGCS